MISGSRTSRKSITAFVSQVSTSWAASMRRAPAEPITTDVATSLTVDGYGQPNATWSIHSNASTLGWCRAEPAEFAASIRAMKDPPVVAPLLRVITKHPLVLDAIGRWPPSTGKCPRQENPMEPSIRFTYPARDGVEIVGYRWDPASQPRGAVQLTHGMGEHVQRYGALARALTDRGLVVYGQDHRGHGATGLALLNVLVDRYRAAGLTDVTVRTYHGARHEILNETNRNEVVTGILE